MPILIHGIWRLSVIHRQVYTPIIKHCVNNQGQKELPVSDQAIEEIAPDVNLANVMLNEEPLTSHRKRNSFKKSFSSYWALLALFTYIVGLGKKRPITAKTFLERIPL